MIAKDTASPNHCDSDEFLVRTWLGTVVVDVHRGGRKVQVFFSFLPKELSPIFVNAVPHPMERSFLPIDDASARGITTGAEAGSSNRMASWLMS